MYGVGSKEFSITTCTDEKVQLDTLMAEAEVATYLGLTPAAEVLLGIVNQSPDEGGLRYAVPTCWGPLHFNLDQASQEDRALLFEAIEDQMENTQ